MLGESTRLFVGIINATNQNVFEGDVLTLARAIVLAGIQELAKGYFRLTGMIFPRTASVAPWREIARRTWSG